MPGIAIPEASWDDAVQFSEHTSYAGSDRLVDEMRGGMALVTAEFMRDAQDAFDVVERILDEETRRGNPGVDALRDRLEGNV